MGEKGREIKGDFKFPFLKLKVWKRGRVTELNIERNTKPDIRRIHFMEINADTDSVCNIIF